jgi:hypothetical protein
VLFGGVEATKGNPPAEQKSWTDSLYETLHSSIAGGKPTASAAAQMVPLGGAMYQIGRAGLLQALPKSALGYGMFLATKNAWSSVGSHIDPEGPSGPWAAGFNEASGSLAAGTMPLLGKVNFSIRDEASDKAVIAPTSEKATCATCGEDSPEASTEPKVEPGAEEGSELVTRQESSCATCGEEAPPSATNLLAKADLDAPLDEEESVADPDSEPVTPQGTLCPTCEQLDARLDSLKQVDDPDVVAKSVESDAFHTQRINDVLVLHDDRPSLTKDLNDVGLSESQFDDMKSERCPLASKTKLSSTGSRRR